MSEGTTCGFLGDVTGDNDLLALKDRYAIVTPAEFWNRHGA